MKPKYISQSISNEDISSWSRNDIITIKALTGSGKSYFIMHKLYNYAVRNDLQILMLVSRKQVIKDFEKDVRGKPNIEIDTYQKVEKSITHGTGYKLAEYDYIVCDEFHYFLSDDFNKWLDISFDKIMQSKNNIKIFMSATGDGVERYFKEHGIDIIPYRMPMNFDRIRQLKFFYEDKTVEGFIEDAINHNQKTIFFIESAEKACELHRKYPKHTMFNCSVDNPKNSKYKKYVDQEKVNNMLETNEFDDLILITTRVMDTGVSIKDPDLHKIVIDIVSASNIIQCLGRKRMMDKNDYIDVHIKARNRKSISAFRRNIEKNKKRMDNLDFNGDYAYLKENYRDDTSSNLIYTEWDYETNQVIHKVNKLNHFKNKLDSEELKEMEEHGYCYHISKVLGRPGNYKIVEEEQEKYALGIYLEGVIGQKLYKADQEQLKDVFKVNGLKSRTLGINTLNGYLKDRQMEYVILPKTTSTKVNGRKKNIRYWSVEGNVEI